MISTSLPTVSPQTRASGQTAPLLLRVGEAAEALAISRTALYALIQSGDVPVIHIGRSVRVDRRVLQAYVDRLAGLTDDVDVVE